MMDKLIGLLETYRGKTNMDANYFYPMIMTFLVPICGVLRNLFLKIKEQYKKRIYELYCKSEGDNFFVCILFSELAIALLSVFGSCFICIMIELFFSIKVFELKLGEALSAIIYAGIDSGISIKMLKMNWIRRRLLGDRDGKRIIICSMLLINVSIMCAMFDGKISYLGFVFWILYFLNEIVGLLYFLGRYVKYEYSSIKLYSNDGECIVCENIEKVSRKKDYVIVEAKDRQIVLISDKIWKAEYYGPPKYILKENMFEKYFRNKLKKSKIEA